MMHGVDRRYYTRIYLRSPLQRPTHHTTHTLQHQHNHNSNPKPSMKIPKIIRHPKLNNCHKPTHPCDNGEYAHRIEMNNIGPFVLLESLAPEADVAGHQPYDDHHLVVDFALFFACLFSFFLQDPHLYSIKFIPDRSRLIQIVIVIFIILSVKQNSSIKSIVQSINQPIRAQNCIKPSFFIDFQTAIILIYLNLDLLKFLQSKGITDTRVLNVLQWSQFITSMGCQHSVESSSKCSEIVRLPNRKNRHGNLNTNKQLNLEPNKIEHGVIKIEYQFRKKEQQEIRSVLQQHFLFRQLKFTEIQRLIDCVQVFIAEKDTCIMKEGDFGHMLFIVRNGSVLIEQTGRNVNILKMGEYFGDMALIYRTPRSASVRAVERTELYGISERIVRKTITFIVYRNFELIKKTIGLVPQLKHLSTREKIQLAQNTLLFNFNKGDFIYHENDFMKFLYIVARGCVELLAPGRNKVLIWGNQTFGDNDGCGNRITGGEQGRRCQSARAHEDETIVLAISKKNVLKYLPIDKKQELIENDHDKNSKNIQN